MFVFKMIQFIFYTQKQFFIILYIDIICILCNQDVLQLLIIGKYEKKQKDLDEIR